MSALYTTSNADFTPIRVLVGRGLCTIDVNGVIVRWGDPDDPGAGVREPRRPAPHAGPTAETAA